MDETPGHPTASNPLGLVVSHDAPWSGPVEYCSVFYAAGTDVGGLVLVALVCAAAAAWAVGLGRVAALTAFAATCWPGARLFNREAPLAVFGLLSGALFLPVASIDLVAALRGGRHRSGDRTILWPAVAVALVGVVRTLVYEPFRDPACFADCPHSPLLLRPDLGLARLLVVVGAAANVVLAVLVARCALRMPRRGRRLDDVLVAVVLAASLAVALAAVGTVARRPVVMPESPPPAFEMLRSLYGLCLVAAVALAAGSRAVVLRRVRIIGRELIVADSVGAAQLRLGAALGDPSLVVGYPDGAHGFVWQDGRPLGPPGHGRHRIELTSRDLDGPVAVIDHSEGLEPDVLHRALSPQVRAAIHNESLEVRLAREVEALTASRRRLVDTADTERMLLERDVHDGAQQRVLALAADLRRASLLASEHGDAARAKTFDAAKDTAIGMLTDLRQLAHGISPSVPLSTDLASALSTLCDAVPEPIELDAGELGVIPDAVGRAVHAVVRDCLATIDSDGVVRIARVGEMLEVAISGLTEFPESAFDRIAVAGGTCERQGRQWQVVLTCE